MRTQRKLRKGTGNDTHVRDQYLNRFQNQSHSTYLMMSAEIKFPQPEPAFKQNYVTVEFARGGEASSISYPGAFIDPLSGNLHGTYEGPIPGQMVMVGFDCGNSAAPFVINRYPYQGIGDSTNEMAYFNPLTKASYDPTDVMIGHFSGSFLRFNTGGISGKIPGSVGLQASSDLDIFAFANTTIETGVLLSIKSTESTMESLASMAFKSPAITIESTGTLQIKSPDIEINGAAKNAIKTGAGSEINMDALVEIKNSAQSLKTLIDSLITVIQAAYTINTVPGSPATLDPAFIALLEAEKVKWALLFK